jgi:hypothetical protein
MMKVRKKIDMYQVVVPNETAARMDRNRKVTLGPVYCKECGKFYEWKADNKLDCTKCVEHPKKIGFRLLDIL